ncbi:polysaccharide deacetylase family protein [Arhodomonas sp. SL1]|uniref:polysaccharide deacetylase family protein n=1 Tax=Arhodomonas sp. SL1 TaxID=3425691 RepID=UPI003F8824E0
MMDALISIHDVMPETLDRVGHHLRVLRRHGHDAITLLVVPGRPWGEADIAQLARWQSQGLELAAHGWHHHAPRLGGPRHWIHSALLSRRAAEHLALGPNAIADLMRKSAAWFPRQNLTPATTYVPPAWALGRIRPEQLRAQPFERIEITRGLLFPATGRLIALPLVGFEADTLMRERFLRAWNNVQARLARDHKRPLRIGIHPQDHELRLAGQLHAFIAGNWRSLRYRDFEP